MTILARITNLWNKKSTFKVRVFCNGKHRYFHDDSLDYPDVVKDVLVEARSFDHAELLALDLVSNNNGRVGWPIFYSCHVEGIGRQRKA